jgi:predicted molibdopterin-dependent oxidoreductase YjgC
MVKLRIDNIELEVTEGTTVLSASEMAGLSIPHICYKEGLPHYSSCMVCIVRNNRTNKFIPSCCAIAEDGMDIDASGEEVLELRKSALELLLSEHRAECEAPCRVVCPAGYNIPLMNRLIAAKNLEKAFELSFSENVSSGIMCKDCPAYCENACRRKKIDSPVSIRQMQLFIHDRLIRTREQGEVTGQEAERGTETYTATERRKLHKRFNSHIGRIEKDELQEWLKECNDKLNRSREIDNLDSASGEALSCMRCDCRAKDDCRLRDLADAFKIKDPRGKMVNSPIMKKINSETGLIFENAKCIKCGLCVRICTDRADDPALCFIGRGFSSLISEPLTEDFSNILKARYKDCIAVCPTGALSDKGKI